MAHGAANMRADIDAGPSARRHRHRVIRLADKRQAVEFLVEAELYEMGVLFDRDAR